MSELVSLELGRVARLELVNPPLNLITQELLEALSAALATLAASSADDVRAVVVSGSGERAFSDRKSTRLNSSHSDRSRMPSSA